MPAKTEPSPLPSVSPETRPVSHPIIPPKNAGTTGPRAYWGDRLTLNFWLFCFGLMLAMELVGAIHRLILFVMSRPLSP
ncbi:MAG TPA: hypothetical protein VH682_04685 [Gemmataceae bacterium]